MKIHIQKNDLKENLYSFLRKCEYAPFHDSYIKVLSRTEERINECGRIGGQAEGVPRVGGSKKRQYEIGAGWNTPISKGLAEILLVAFESQMGGGIKKTGHSDGGIDREASEVLDS